MVSARNLRKTDFYHHCFPPLEIRCRLAARVNLPSCTSGFVVNRGGSRDFTQSEVELIRRLRPHVGRVHAQTLHVADLRQQLARAAFHTSGATSAELTNRETEELHWLTMTGRIQAASPAVGAQSNPIS